MKDITPEALRKLLRYEPTTGKLYWRERTPDMFDEGKYDASRTCKSFNTRCAGKEAFTAYHKDGYKHGVIFGKPYLAHRVIWAIVNGEWPKVIDHVNGDRSDNRIGQLSNGSHQTNAKNAARRVDNNSGVCGVGWFCRYGKWVSRIQVNGKRKTLGYFTSFEEAVEARKKAEKVYGFHENHGRG